GELGYSCSTVPASFALRDLRSAPAAASKPPF
ncbi:uncharacterized, partial [Tachysurus ichikawai]